MQKILCASFFAALAALSARSDDSLSTNALAAPLSLSVVATEPAAETITIDASQAAKATVFVFLSATCPCSLGHEAKLKRMAAEFAPQGIAFVGIHANADESQADARKHFEAAKLGFPVVRDDGRLADALGALKTPHAFIVSKDRKLLYSGGVDDSKDAARAKTEYLRDSLAQVAAGEVPKIREARTLGCIIKRKSNL